RHEHLRRLRAAEGAAVEVRLHPRSRRRDGKDTAPIRPSRLARRPKRMNPTQKLHHHGQSLWLDYITRELLTAGTPRSYIHRLSVTGLTSNPTIFDQAFLTTAAYDDGIRAAASRGRSTEDVFLTLAIEDLQAAADLFRPVFERTQGLDGWVSLEV